MPGALREMGLPKEIEEAVFTGNAGKRLSIGGSDAGEDSRAQSWRVCLCRVAQGH